jgi:hypothetical protein
MTICWHVDDLFLGNADPDVVTQFLEWLPACYDTAEKKLNITRGPCHDNLGMNIDFLNKGAVTFDMIPYIGKIFQAFPEKITGMSSTPATDHLFTIWPIHESTPLPEEQARAYYHTTAPLLFLSCVRPDIQTTVALLTTSMKQPDKDDWGKLKRVLKYLNSTCYLPLTLFPESLTNIHWYVDASHQTYDDCKGHTGSFLTFGKGATTSSSIEQKIPSKSSSDSDIIALHDKTSDVFWTHQFLEAQGYNTSTIVLFQDNMSTLSLAKNGNGSSLKCTKQCGACQFGSKCYPT